jgi:hypothetical protein
LKKGTADGLVDSYMAAIAFIGVGLVVPAVAILVIVVTHDSRRVVTLVWTDVALLQTKKEVVDIWFGFVVASIMLVSGVLLMIYRTKFARVNGNLLRKYYGRPGQGTARRSTPAQMAIVAVILIFAGTVGMLASIFGRPVS